MKTLVYVFHPNLNDGSRVNLALATAAANAGYEVRDIYQEYPEFQIDVKKEQTILESADCLVLQFPIFWYQTPALMKEWFDRVLEYGWAYGSQGKALQGKEVLLVPTFGAGAEDYQVNGRFNITPEEVLKPIETIQYHTGLKFMKPFMTMGTLTLTDEALKEMTKNFLNVLD